MQSIHRQRTKRSNFTVIDNRIFNDDRLTFEQIGLLSYILSKPDDWVIRIEQLRKKGNIGRTSMQKLMRHLEACGYATLVKTKNSSGLFSGSYWSVHELPMDAPENNATENPKTGHSELRTIPIVGTIISTDNLLNKDNIQKREKSAPKAVDSTSDLTASGSTLNQVVPTEASTKTVNPSPSENPFEERERAATYYENSQYVIQQGEKYTTDSDLVAVMANYYRNNPQEYKVGILQDAKGARFTPEQIKDFTVMWAAHAIANNKYNRTAHQLHLDLKKWILRESQYSAKSMKQAGCAAAPVIKKKTVDFI
jgi:L-amino acid N-acyltransferase YncA